MKSGITGLPKAGKTTIFEILTRNFSDAGNKTESRIGTVTVPDSRVDNLSEMYKPKKTTFAQVTYYLPAQQGQQKNQHYWAQLRDCDALIHVVRSFAGYGLEAPTPLKDIRYLDQEMVLADLLVVEKRLENLEQEKQRGKKFNPEEFELLIACKQQLENEIPLRKCPELASEPRLKGFTFLSAKPLLILFNNEEHDTDPPDGLDGAIDETHLVIRGRLEHDLARMDETEAADYLKAYEIQTTAMERVVRESYALLGLISFFTVGDDEVKAWTIRQGSVALDAADAIHSDIKKGFIRAEVLYYDDLMQAGSYANARKNGTFRLEGKTYPVRDGDIVHFRFNV
jgi:ribosome-binding ATPase